MVVELSVETLAADPNNARTISDAAAKGLDVSLQEFGDLSGITFNERTGHLVGGHQRMTRLRAAGAKTWVREGDAGWIVDPRTGERFGIRIVDWDETKERLANLTANNPEIAGEYTPEAAAQLEELATEARFAELRLAELAEEIAPPPEVNAGNRSATSQLGGMEYRLVVTCTGEEDQLTLMTRMEGEGRKCQPLIS